MKQILKVRHKSSYGRNLYTPENQEARAILALISPRRKTFTAEQVAKAEELGYTIEILPMIVPGVNHEKP